MSCINSFQSENFFPSNFLISQPLPLVDVIVQSVVQSWMSGSCWFGWVLLLAITLTLTTNSDFTRATNGLFDSLITLIPLVGDVGLRLVLRSLPTGQVICGRCSVPALNLWKFSIEVTIVTYYVAIMEA